MEREIVATDSTFKVTQRIVPLKLRRENYTWQTE